MTTYESHGEIGSSPIQRLTKAIKVTIAPNQQLIFAKINYLESFGTFWDFISLNAKVSSNSVELKKDEFFQINLDLDAFSPGENSIIFLNYLALTFFTHDHEVDHPPLKLDPSAPSFPVELGPVNSPNSGRLPIITSSKKINQSVVSFRFLTQPLPPGVAEITYQFNIVGSLAVAPYDKFTQIASPTRSLPFSFDPQLRIVTG